MKNSKKDVKQLMKLNRLLSSNKVLLIIIIVVDTTAFLVLNYIINLIIHCFEWIKMQTPFDMGWKNIFLNFSILKDGILPIYGLAVMLIAVIDVVLIYKIKSSYSEENFNVNQKGDMRWTTLEEIKAQYKEIPEKDDFYPGYPGTIISRHKDKIYIDDSVVNNLYMGTTRSGKGEEHVFPNIDVMSRAEFQPSIIVGDPKLENYKSSKTTLVKRGFDVHLLNLIDPLHGMGFNPLELCVDRYWKGEYADAELLVNSVAFSIYTPDESKGSEKFFDSTAADLLSALILAHMIDCVDSDKKRIETYLRKRKIYDCGDTHQQDVWKTIFFDTYKRVGNNIVEADTTIAIPPEYKFEEHYYSKKVTMYSVINMMTELATIHINQYDTMLDMFFLSRKPMDRAKMKYTSIQVSGDRTKGSIFASMLTVLTVFTYENIAKMTAETTINLEDIGFGNKPIAIFLGLPDYDRSTYFIASMFIRQVYFVLARRCAKEQRGSCARRVKFLIDEAGTLPTIDDLMNMVTVGLGRGISFDLYIQSDQQMKKKYKEDYKTIKENCSNHIYILSGDEETAKKFSEMLGPETIIDIDRSGGKLDLNKNFRETPTEKLLLNMNQLFTLEENSCVIRRIMKRTDLKWNRVRPFPIYNCADRGTPMKRRYEYLLDTFPNPSDVRLEDINTESREHINIKERVFDFKKSIPQSLLQEIYDSGGVYRPPFEPVKHGNTEKKKLKINEYIDSQKLESLKSVLIQVFGEDYETEYDISLDMTPKDFQTRLVELGVTETVKRGIMSYINIKIKREVRE